MRRSLGCLLIFLLNSLANASTPPSFPCEPSGEIQKQIESIESKSDKFEAKVAMLRELLKKHSEDLFVHRAYQRQYFVEGSHTTELIAEYKALSKKHKDNPLFLYLYAHAMADVEDEKAIRIYQEALTLAPDFPQVHSALAGHYSFLGKKHDRELKKHVGEGIRLCPDSPDSYLYLDQIEDPPFLQKSVTEVRNRLATKPSERLLSLYQTLWNIDFKVTPVERHDEVRKRIAEDVERLRQHEISDLQWWLALKDGAYYLEDYTEVARVVDEISHRFPKDAPEIVRDHWFKSHARPLTKQDEKEYDQAYLKATQEWIRKWPQDPWVCVSRLSAVSAEEGVSTEQVEEAAKNILKILDGGTSGISASNTLQFDVARLYIAHNIHLDLVPALLEKGEEEYQKSSQWMLDDPELKKDAESENDYVLWEKFAILAKWHLKKKELDSAQAALGQMDSIGKKHEKSWWSSEYFELQAQLADARNQKDEAARYYALARKDEEPGAKDAIEEVMPDFILKDLDGRRWRPSDLKDKVVFINVWATWCGPCAAELPLIQKLHEQLKDREDVLLLTFNTDSEIGLVRPFTKQNRFTFPVLLAESYVNQVRPEDGIPQNWLVDKNGNLRMTRSGFDSRKKESFVRETLRLIESYRSKK